MNILKLQDPYPTWVKLSQKLLAGHKPVWMTFLRMIDHQLQQLAGPKSLQQSKKRLELESFGFNNLLVKRSGLKLRRFVVKSFAMPHDGSTGHGSSSREANWMRSPRTFPLI